MKREKDVFYFPFYVCCTECKVALYHKDTHIDLFLVDHIKHKKIIQQLVQEHNYKIMEADIDFVEQV